MITLKKKKNHCKTGNEIRNEGAASLSEALKNNTTLKILKLLYSEKKKEYRKRGGEGEEMKQ